MGGPGKLDVSMKNIIAVPSLFAAALALWIWPSAGEASQAGQWFTSIYAGQYSHNALNEIIRLQTNFESSYIYVLSVGKEIGRWKKYVAVELEGEAGVHAGMQSNGELNGAFTLRWLPFPWDRYLDTSFAFGNGLSYAFEEPKLEIIDNEYGETNQWLYYILVELAAQVPKLPQWDFFIRIHHRSSAFGLIGGISAGSNFVGVGLRYHFL
jgi:hypothetical protein